MHSSRRLLSAALVLVAAPAAAQDAARPITAGETRTFRSAILNENREIRIALPESYDQTTLRYPVLYLLDGSPEKLVQGAGVTRFLAAARNRIPEMIVVAIPNTNRNRDLTPGPGAETFERFLAEELLPWVEREWRAAPDRVLVGHSLGGSLVAHAALNRPTLFRGYLAVSAPVWRYDGFADQLAPGIARAAAAGVSLHLTVGELENPQLRGGMEGFAAALRKAPAAPTWSWGDLPGEDHSSTFLRSLYAGLESRYTGWRFPFFEDSAGFAAAGGLAALEAHHARLAARFGYRVVPPAASLVSAARFELAADRHAEVMRLALAYRDDYLGLGEGMVWQVAADQLRRGRTADALATLRRGTTTFPAAIALHDALGDALCTTGDPTGAKAARERAATLAESTKHRRAVELRGKVEKGCGKP